MIITQSDIDTESDSDYVPSEDDNEPDEFPQMPSQESYYFSFHQLYFVRKCLICSLFNLYPPLINTIRD